MTTIMIINQVLRVQGWLPAGLVLNTLLDMADRGDGKITCVPQLAQGKNKWTDQENDPAWIKVPQANQSWAIKLKGRILSPFFAGALKGNKAPLMEEPCVLLDNVMYEGDILVVSGEELPISRVAVSPNYPSLYSTYYGISDADILAKRVYSGVIMPAEAAQIVVTDPDGLVNFLAASPVTYSIPGSDPVLAYTAQYFTPRFMTQVGLKAAYTELAYTARLNVVNLLPANPTVSFPEGINAAVLQPQAADTAVKVNSSRVVTGAVDNSWPAKELGSLEHWVKLNQNLVVVGTSC